MGYHEEYEARMKKIRDELDQIIDQNPNGKEMLDKRFLKNFGKRLPSIATTMLLLRKQYSTI